MDKNSKFNDLLEISELSKHVASYLEPGSIERAVMNTNNNKSTSKNDQIAFDAYLQYFIFDTWEISEDIITDKFGMHGAPGNHGVIDVEIDLLSRIIENNIKYSYLNTCVHTLKLISNHRIIPFEWSPGKLLTYIKAMGSKRWKNLLIMLYPIKPVFIDKKPNYFGISPKEWKTNSRGAPFVSIGYQRIAEYSTSTRENPLSDAMLMPSPETLAYLIARLLEGEPELFNTIFPASINRIDRIYDNLIPFQWMLPNESMISQCGMIHGVFQIIETTWTEDMRKKLIPRMKIGQSHARVLMATMLGMPSTLRMVGVFETIITSCSDVVASEIVRVFNTYMCGYGEALPNYDYDELLRLAYGKNTKDWTHFAVPFDHLIPKMSEKDISSQYDTSARDFYRRAMLPLVGLIYDAYALDIFYDSNKIDDQVIRRGVENWVHLQRVGQYYGLDPNGTIGDRKCIVEFEKTIVAQSGMSKFFDIMIGLVSENETVAFILGSIWGYADAVFDGAMTVEMRKKIAAKIEKSHRKKVTESYRLGVDKYDAVRNALFSKQFNTPAKLKSRNRWISSIFPEDAIERKETLKIIEENKKLREEITRVMNAPKRIEKPPIWEQNKMALDRRIPSVWEQNRKPLDRKAKDLLFASLMNIPNKKDNTDINKSKDLLIGAKNSNRNSAKKHANRFNELQISKHVSSRNISNRVETSLQLKVNDDRYIQPLEGVYEILPRLYLSSLDYVKDELALKSLGITHIISVMDHPPKFTKGLFEWLHINVRDGSAKIVEYFDEAGKWIDDTLHQSPFNRVLVHCEKGQSRSPTIIIAYLIKYGRLPVEDATQLLFSKKFKGDEITKGANKMWITYPVFLRMYDSKVNGRSQERTNMTRYQKKQVHSDREKISSFIGTNRDGGSPSEIPDEIINEILGFYMNENGTNGMRSMTISQYYSLLSISKEWKTKLESVEFIKSVWWEIDIPSLLKTIETHGISESLQKILNNATHVEVQNFMTDQTLYDAKQKFISKKYGFDKEVVPTMEILKKSETGKVVFPSCVHFCIQSTKQKQIQSMDMYHFLVDPGYRVVKGSSVPISNVDQFGYVYGESMKGLYMNVDVFFDNHRNRRNHTLNLTRWSALERFYIRCPKLYEMISVPKKCYYVAANGYVQIRISKESESKTVLLQNSAGLLDIRTKTDSKTIVYAVNQQWDGDEDHMPIISMKMRMDTVICVGGPVDISSTQSIEKLVLFEESNSNNRDNQPYYRSIRIKGNPNIGKIYFENKKLREKETKDNSVLIGAKIINDTVPIKYKDLAQKFQDALLDYRKFSILHQ